MVIAKVREYLGVGFAVVAAVAIGYGVITNLRLDAAQVSLDKALSNNENLIVANEELYNTVDDLISQRRIDDQLLTLLHNEFDNLASESRVVRERVDEIKENDTEFKALLSERHPPDLNGVFNRRTTGQSDAESQDKTAE